MNLKNAGIICLFFILLMSIPQVAGQDTQGLYWGITEDTRVDYHYYYLYPESFGSATNQLFETEFDFYFIVNELPVLPDHTTNVFYILPDYSLSFYFVNDTVLENSQNVLLVQLLFPIGNWSLYTDYVNSFTHDDIVYEIIDELSVWGFRLTIESGSEESSFWTLYQDELIISKTDGCVDILRSSVTNLFTNEEYHLKQITRVQFPFVPLLFSSLIFAEVVFAIIIYKKFKGRPKKPVERKVDVNLDDLLNGF